MKTFSLLNVGFLSICVSAGVFGQTGPAPTQANKSQPGPPHTAGPVPSLCAACVRAHMEFLASDALRGRGSGTADELVAATYVAAQLRAYGIAPAGHDGGYLQRATLQQPKFTAPPQLTFTQPGAGGEKVTWTSGKEFAAVYLAQTHFSGLLRVMNATKTPPRLKGPSC